jgi:prepilin-type N-terminal cleavage/methylation domain-containing protein
MSKNNNNGYRVIGYKGYRKMRKKPFFYTLQPSYPTTLPFSGFTMIEVMIYIAIFGMIAVTLVSLAYVSAREDQGTVNDVINAYENNI